MALTQIKTTGIADDAVTLAKQAAGTDGQIITYDASGNPTAVGPGTDGQVLTSTGSGSPPAFEDATGGIASLVADTSPQLGGDLDTNSFEISLDDDHKVKFGAGNDLTIYHDASGGHNHIHGATNCPIIFKTNDSERCRITSGGDLNFENDSSKITLGTGQDLQLYHDGTHSYIKNTHATGYTLLQVADGEYGAKLIPNGACELYYDNAKKFETQSIGITVTGQVKCDELNLADSTGAGNNRIKCGTGDDISIYHDGSNSYIAHTGTGELYINSGSAHAIQCSKDGAVNLRHNGYTKIETISTGVNISGGIRLGGNNAVNELDDYEEGTWTPVWNTGSASTAMMSAAAYEASTGGTYVKVGRLVTFTLNIECSSHTARSSCHVILAGLPFTSENVYKSGGATISFGTAVDEDNTGDVPTISAHPGAAYLAFYYTNGSNFESDDDSTNWNARLSVHGHYFTA